MRSFAPLVALAGAAAGALVARRRSAGAAAAPAVEASPTAPDPAVRAAAAQATPPGPPPAPAPEPGSAAAAELGGDAPAAEPTGEPHPVGLYVLHQGPRADQALMALAQALGESATLGPPDDVGRFDAQVVAATPAEAEERVRAALRSSGTGDDFTIVTGTQGREMAPDDPRQPDR